MDCFWRPLVELLYLGSCGCVWSTGLCGNDARDAEREMARRYARHNRERRGLAPRNDVERLSHGGTVDETEQREYEMQLHQAECRCVHEDAPEIDIPTFVQRCQTGDLVLFVAHGLKAQIIQKFVHSEFMHVGMVWRPPKSPHTPLLLESNGNLIINKHKYNGPCGVPLADRLYESLSGMYSKHYTAVFVLRIKVQLPRSNLPDPTYVLRTWEHKYRMSLMTMIMGIYDGPFGRLTQEPPMKKHYEFCSEYVAELYKAMRLLPDSIADTEYTPADFTWPQLTVLNNGLTLGKHQRVVTMLEHKDGLH